MKAIILNASSGVGKTSLLKQLESEKRISNIAVIDGDDVGRIIPLEHTLEWLNLIQDNMISCALNYKTYGIKLLIISFVFPSEERLERIKTKLSVLGIETKIVCIYCENKILADRLVKRNTSRIISIERAVECNNIIKSLEADYSVDTSYMNTKEVSEHFISVLNRL